MPRIERYYSQERKSGPDLNAAYAEGLVADKFGALDDVAQAAKDISDTLFTHDRNVKGLDVLDAVVNAERELLAHEREFKKLKGRAAAETFDQTKKFIDETVTKYTKEFTPEQTRAFKDRFKTSEFHSLRSSFSYQQQEELVYRKEHIENAYTVASQAVIQYSQEPGAEQKYQDKVSALMNDIDLTMPKGEATTQLKATYAARLGVRYRGFEDGIAWLKDVNNIEKLLPESRKSLVREFEIEFGNELRRETAESKEEFEGVQQSFFKQALDDDLTIDEIEEANLPVQGPGGKIAWRKYIEAQAEAGKTGKEARKVSDPDAYEKAWRLANRGMLSEDVINESKLTLAHRTALYDRSKRIQKEGMTVEDKAVEEFRKELKSLVRGGSFLEGASPENKQRAYDTGIDIDRAIEAGKKEGKRYQDLIDPEHKDYIGWEVLKANLKPGKADALSKKVMNIKPVPKKKWYQSDPEPAPVNQQNVEGGQQKKEVRPPANKHKGKVWQDETGRFKSNGKKWIKLS